jgi:prepilin peptidase CpaA
MSMLWQLCFAVAALISAVAVMTDLRQRRIPNWLTIPSAVVGLLFHGGVALASGGIAAVWSDGLGPALAGCAFLLFLFATLGALHLMGMGDAKLLGAIGAWLRWPMALRVLFYVLVAGGIVSLVALGIRGLGRSRDDEEEEEARQQRLRKLPYAIAIFSGVVWAWIVAATGIARLL